jgi:serine protease Do
MARWSLPLACLILGGVAGSFVVRPQLLGQNPVNAPAPVIPKEITSYRDVVKKVLPAVVSIESRVKKVKAKADDQAPRRRPRVDDDRIPEDFRKFFEQFGSAPFEMPEDSTPTLGFGSGFLVSPKGVILTNYHVVDGAGEVVVQLKDGRKYTSRDIKGDRKTDLAIVRIDAKSPLPYLELGDSDAMEIGDRVLAVGAPFGLTGSVTAGIVSAKGRNGFQMNMYEDFIQTDAAINPGNSGGPLVNLAGQVIGINSAIKSRSGGFQGVGLAIASNMAKRIYQSLEKDGVVHRAYLGVQIADLQPDVANRLGLKDNSGVVVTTVFDGSPAAKAGLQEGDVITSLGGKAVKDGRELQHAVTGLPLNKPADLAVVRDGKAKVLQVTVEEQPQDFGVARAPRPRSRREESESLSVGKVGLAVKELTPEEAEQLGYKATTTGVLVTRVTPNSPAAEAGLRRDMVIAKVDRQPVKSPTQFQQLVEKGSLDKGVLLQVQTPQGGTNYVVLKATGSLK